MRGVAIARSAGDRRRGSRRNADSFLSSDGFARPENGRGTRDRFRAPFWYHFHLGPMDVWSNDGALSRRMSWPKRAFV
jgi:hypothetical protein